MHGDAVVAAGARRVAVSIAAPVALVAPVHAVVGAEERGEVPAAREHAATERVLAAHDDIVLVGVVAREARAVGEHVRERFGLEREGEALHLGAGAAGVELHAVVLLAQAHQGRAHEAPSC
uniref:Uncharacterized protein n=1 Tax=Phaeomonas parva TaxID=124430 RepID=A0A7S1UG33_9STRA